MKALLIILIFLSGRVILAQKPSIVKTDSSRIETRLYPGGREVLEILMAKDLIYYRFYRNNNSKVTTTATHNKSGRTIGVSREYDDQGKFLYAIDHDQGKWIVANKKSYLFYDLRNKMKLKADSIIAANYGQEFLKENVIWNVQSSNMHNQAVGGNWTDIFEERPIKFTLEYDVKLDREHVYKELIRVELDAKGHFIRDDFEKVSGFEKLDQKPTKGFELLYQEAIETAKKKSGNFNQPLQGFLTWESFKKPTFYNGHFRFYVPIKSGSIKNLNSTGRSTITDQFDVYSFSPWTGAFIEKKKMNTVKSWEANSGFSTGLMPNK